MLRHAARDRFLVAVSRFSMHYARPWPRAVTQERPPQKGQILPTNRAEARVKRERVGHPLSDVVEHLLHPGFRWGRGFGPKLPSISTLFALARQPISRAPGKRKSDRKSTRLNSSH